MSHDPSADWFMPLSCTAFLDDEVVFDANAGKQKKTRTGTGTGKDNENNDSVKVGAKGKKTVDLFLLKTKCSTKTLASLKLTKTGLYEALAKAKNLRKEQVKLYDKMSSFLARSWTQDYAEGSTKDANNR